MPAIPGTVLASKISPGDTDATFATHEDSYGQGGLRTVLNYHELTSIPLDRQKLGMMIYESSTDTYHKVTTLGFPLTGVSTNFSFTGVSPISATFQRLSVGTPIDSSVALTVAGNVSVRSQIGGYFITYFNLLSSTGSIAEGRSTATGIYSHAEGNLSQAIGGYSHAEGSAATASGFTSHAEGDNTLASGEDSHAEGHFTIASGLGSHAEGSMTSTGERLVFSGFSSNSQASIFTFASNISSKTEGISQGSVIGGYGRTPFGNHTFFRLTVLGRDPITGALSATPNNIGGYQLVPQIYTYIVNNSGIYAHSEGNHTIASGESSHAEGVFSIASGRSSHAEGDQTLASGEDSHAEGNFTLASGAVSHAEGRSTQAIGGYSHAAGIHSTANHFNSWIWRGTSTYTGSQVATTRAGQFMVSADGGSVFHGNVGINTDANQQALTVNGNIQLPNTSSRLIFGYDAVTSNDGAELYMDYSAGGDLGEFYITTRDNGNEPIIFRQRKDDAEPSAIFEPIVIGSDHNVGINVPTTSTLSARTFGAQLTVYGTVSATSTTAGHTLESNSSRPALRVVQYGGGDSLVIDDQAADTSPFVISNNGTMFIGATGAFFPSAPSRALAHIVNPSSFSRRCLELRNHSVPATPFSPPELRFTRSRSGNSNDFTQNVYPLSANESVGQITFGGATTNNFNAVTITAQTKLATSTGTVSGGTLTFATHRISDGSVANVMMLDEGRVAIGPQATNPNEALTVTGNISSTATIFASGSNIPVSVVNVTTNRVFTNEDSNRIFHFDTTTSTLTAIFPDSLSSGFNIAIMNTGTRSLNLSAGPGLTYKALSSRLNEQYAGAYVYRTGNDIFAVGGL